MTSSLASQLSGLRSLNATRLASSTALTSHSSYLFPPRTAASQDLDTIFSLGETGFNELILEDATFEKWHAGQTLFGPPAKGTDRTMLGKEENAALDRTIEEFLEMLGPVILSKSAAKCLEWLVRRFRIHDFNPLAVLRVFLPYHQTPQFARMLHILDLSSQPYLSFLLPLQKTTQPLPTSILLSAMLAPPSSSHSLDLIRFVTQSISTSSASKTPKRPQILFWSSTLVQLCTRIGGITAGAESSMGLARSAKKHKSVANASTKQDDEQLILSIILPAAIKAATSYQLGIETQTAGALVLCAIGTTFHLSTAAVTATVAELWTSTPPGKSFHRQFSAFITASIALSSSIDPNDTAKIITGDTARSLLLHRTLAADLTQMAQSYDLQRFLAALFHAFVALAISEDSQAATAAAVLQDLVELPEARGGVDSSALKDFVGKILSTDSTLPADLVKVLATCRQTRPEVWNAALGPFTSPDASADRKKRVNEVLSQLATLQVLGTSSASSSASIEWLKLNSAEPNQRALALEAFVASLTESSSTIDPSAVQEVLLPRLADEDEAVLKILYSANGQVLLDAAPSFEVILKPIETITKTTNVFSAALQLHLAFLLGPFLSRHPKAANRVLRNMLWPCLLTTRVNKEKSSVLRRVVRKMKSVGQLSALFKDIDTSDDEASTRAVQMDKTTVTALASWINGSENDSHWNSHISFLFASLAQDSSILDNSSSKVLSLLVINELLRITSGSPRFDSIARRLFELANTSLILTTSTDYSLLATNLTDKAWQVIYEQPFKAMGLLFWQSLLVTAEQLKFIIKTSNKPKQLLGMSPEDEQHQIALARQLYEVANQSTHDALARRQLLAVLFSQLGENAGSFLAGLCMVSGSDDDGLTSVALKHLRAFLAAYSTDKASHMRDFQTLIPTLLIVWSRDSTGIRKAALECLQLVTLMAKEGSASSDSTEVEVWGFDGIYGSASESLKYLDCASTYQFCFELSKHEESLTNDASFVSNLLGILLTTSKGQDKKEVNFKRSVMAYLLSHVDALPSYKAKLQLLRLLTTARDSMKLLSLTRLIEATMIEAQSAAHLFDGQLNEEEGEEFARLLFEAFDKRSKPLLQDSTTGTWSLLLKAAASSQPLACKNAVLAVARVYQTISADQRREAVELIVKVLARPDIRAPPEVRQALASIEMDASVLTPILAQLRDKISSRLLPGGDSPAAKKTKISSADNSLELNASVLGELLESSLSHSLPPNGPLILELFEVLRCLADLNSSNILNGDYLLHLCMSNLNRLLESAMPTSAIVQSVRVDTVVNVIKASSNPSTFQQALLLLSLVASLAPELVLHSAMPIFTFVGSNVLQRDDAFSFTVVERVLQSILPPLVRSLKSRSDLNRSSFTLLKASRPFLCIFTDSATHIPRHRRQVFFQLLVDVLGPQDYSAAVTMLLVDRSAHKIARQTSGDTSSALQLSLAVLGAQSGAVQLQALNEIWQEARRLWDTKDLDAAQISEHVFLDRLSSVQSEHSEKQVNARMQVIALLSFIKAVFSSSRALAGRQISASSSSDATYLTFVESALTMERCQDEVISALARDTMDGVMALIPISLFMGIVEKLVSEADGKHIGSGFQLLANRVAKATAAEREVVAASSSTIINAARGHLIIASDASRSAALVALDVLSRSAHQQELQSLAQTLAAILDLATEASVPSGDKQKAFSILRSLAATLGPRLIAHLKPLVELCLATIVNPSAPRSIVLRSFETLDNLFKNVTTFMDSHVKSTLSAFCTSHLRDLLDERSPTTIGKSLHQVLTTIIKRIASEKVFGCLFDLWGKVSQSASEREHSLAVLSLLNKTLNQTDRGGISSNYKAVFRFVLRVLDIRRLTKTLSLQDIDAIEDATVRVFVRLVLKLNETTFRPLFLRIYDWAALDLVEEDENIDTNDVGLISRRIALYKINNALTDQLRGLVSHYYSTLLDLTIELLIAFRNQEIQNAQLWSTVLSSVTKSATYDEGTFWNPGRLSKLAPVLVGQVSLRNRELVSNLGGSDQVTRCIAPAVAQLAKTVPDEASLKVLNSALLTQLRLDHPATRVAALHVATTMWSESSLAAVLLGLVPETVPHIAELMENDEPEVRDATGAFIAAVEKVLGEPLDSYLQ